MFEAAQIKHAYTAVLATADKNIDAVGAESHIVDFFVVRNELRLGSQRGNIPDSASSINARGNDEARRNSVPVKRCERSGVIGSL